MAIRDKTLQIDGVDRLLLSADTDVKESFTTRPQDPIITVESQVAENTFPEISGEHSLTVTELLDELKPQEDTIGGGLQWFIRDLLGLRKPCRSGLGTDHAVNHESIKPTPDVIDDSIFEFTPKEDYAVLTRYIGFDDFAIVISKYSDKSSQALMPRNALIYMHFICRKTFVGVLSPA